MALTQKLDILSQTAATGAAAPAAGAADPTEGAVVAEQQRDADMPAAQAPVTLLSAPECTHPMTALR